MILLRPFILFLILLVLCLFIPIIYLIKPKGLNYSYIRFFSKIILKLYGFNIYKMGESNDKSAIIIANHISYWDILVISYLYRGSFVAKASVRFWPILGWAAEVINTIFVDRNKGKKAINKLHRKSKKILKKKNNNIIIFPQGTTSTDINTKPFKGGAFALAKNTAYDIKPVAITYDKLDSVKWVGKDTLIGHLLRLTFIRRINVYVYEFNHIDARYNEVKDLKNISQNLISEKLTELSKIVNDKTF
jgi:1-acyl-sn-glycerol-3-phosphate acyltransferase